MLPLQTSGCERGWQLQGVVTNRQHPLQASWADRVDRERHCTCTCKSRHCCCWCYWGGDGVARAIEQQKAFAHARLQQTTRTPSTSDDRTIRMRHSLRPPKQYRQPLSLGSKAGPAAVRDMTCRPT